MEQKGVFPPAVVLRIVNSFIRYVLSKCSPEKTCCAIQRTDDKPGVLIKQLSFVTCAKLALCLQLSWTQLLP